MLFYSKEAALLVYDQVNRDNPDMVVELTPAIAALTSGPTTVSSNGRNTKAVFTGFPGSGLQGNATVYYDRINLAQLFNFVPLVSIEDTVTTYQDALPTINDALGLSLTAADIQNPTTALPKPNISAQTLKLTISGNCPAFTGSLTVTYRVPGGASYPDSGPGPKELLQGNTIAGYFGTTTSAELFTHQQLITEVFKKGTLPSIYVGTEGWHKFFYQGRVIYVPITQIADKVSWNTLYNEGVVYGTDDNGKYPATAPVNQGRVISFAGPDGERFYFTVRLPSGGKDPYVPGTPTAAELAGSEAELINFLYNGQWGKLTGGFWTNYTLFRDTLSTNNAYNRVATLSGSAWSNFAKATGGGTFYWIPILELVDKNTVTLGLEDVLGNVDHTLQPIPVTPVNTMELHPPVLGNAKTVDFGPVLFSTDNSMALHPPALGLPKTVDFTPIAFTAEMYTPPES
ncbi:virion structural protein [Erwinia phage vB_EamM_Caitlin]|uniref:virion structural protein n=1 Tax=Erwinia phage vB_EamM_Caitlin TaxID=1883379 RepID=UPI00081D1E69|nr:virion structural protein [Erwinia phage vB_EamM_Caitlin]ANZ48449.1 putative virion structural protein [Erwinia phage vB_EamM_Caitlin]